MRGTKVSLGVLAALLGSTALVQAQDAAGGPQFTLTGTGGIVGLMMPSFDPGIFGNTDNGMMFGGMVGGNLTGSLGPVGEYEALVSLNVFGVFGMSAGSSSTTTLSGPGIVTIYGLTTPDSGSIDLDAGAGTVAITGANGAGIGFGGGGGIINDARVTPDDPGFINGWYTDGTGPGNGGVAAYGAIADDSGGIFIASGDFEGLEIATDISRQVFYGGADLTLGLSGQGDGGVSFVGYAGPSVKTIGDVATTTINVSIATEEDDGTSVILPEWAISREDMLSSLYLGGVVGGNVAILGSPGVIYSFGVEGGLYGVAASWQGQDTYSTCCGVDGVGVPSPDLSVTADPVIMDFASAMAFSAKANASVSHALDANKALTLGGSVEYLSHVAQVSHSGYVDTGGSEDWAAPTPSGGTTTLSWGDMLALGVTASLTGTF